MGPTMDILGNTLATIGAAWICLLATIVLFDYFQNAINGQANILLAGWSFFDIVLLSLPGIALVAIGMKVSRIF